MALRSSRSFGRFVLLVALLATAAPTLALAQDATPAPTTTDGVTLAASGLANPRGFTWDAAGTLYVALAGVGGSTMSGGDSPHEQIHGAVMGGATASVVRIEGGCPVTVATGLPSTRGMSGHDQGPAAVAFLDGQLYVLQDAAGGMEDVGPDFPNGVYAVNAEGGVRLVADLSSWIRANPVAQIPYDQTALGEPFAMLAGPDFLWVLEANNGQVLRVTADGDITRVADLSAGHPVPTGFALAPDGGVYVGFLTPTPYVDGSSKVVKVAADGTVTDVWTGLTMVTGLAVGADGSLYALEMATGNTDAPPFIAPGTGRVLRQTGPASSAEVITGLDYPIAMAIGPDGGLYVAFPAFGADDDLGGIVRVDVADGQARALPPGLLATSRCAVATPVASPVAAASPATPAMPAPAATPGATPAADGKDATGALAVRIQDFAFDPPTVEIPAGTIVTWTNLDAVAHTATAADGAFDSGNLDPGQSFSFTFDAPGTHDYVCRYHPNMRGTVVVE